MVNPQLSDFFSRKRSMRGTVWFKPFTREELKKKKNILALQKVSVKNTAEWKKDEPRFARGAVTRKTGNLNRA